MHGQPHIRFSKLVLRYITLSLGNRVAGFVWANMAMVSGRELSLFVTAKGGPEGLVVEIQCRLL